MPKILLVEDNDINREMLSYRLERKNYKLLIAVDGAEAVSLAIAKKPDLILMDLSLPIMNGWEATQQIKANPATQNIPIIALTAHAMSGDRQKALEAGCDDYSIKPIDFPGLIEKMKVLLEQKLRSQPEQVTSQRAAVGTHLSSKSAAAENLAAIPTVKAEATKILLVEDDATNREMLSYRLERKNYELLIAVDGTEAVSLAVAEKPDLILMDLSLPIMNGWEATQQIKANPATQNIPIIALTAHAMSGDRQKALEAGCDDYSTKPIDFPDLIEKMKASLAPKLSSQPQNVTSIVDVVGATTHSELISGKKLKQDPTKLLESHVIKPLKTLSPNLDLEEQRHLHLSSRETDLLQLKQIIKVVYSPIGKRSWRTGSLVKLSQQRAEIHSKRMNLISLGTEVEIRFFISGDLKLSERVFAEILEISRQEDKYFLIEFSAQYNQIIELLRTVF